jgi:hypothetical protein
LTPLDNAQPLGGDAHARNHLNSGRPMQRVSVYLFDVFSIVPMPKFSAICLDAIQPQNSRDARRQWSGANFVRKVSCDVPRKVSCDVPRKISCNVPAKSQLRCSANEISRTQFVANFDRCGRNVSNGLCVTANKGTFADDHTGLRRISAMFFVGQVRCGSGRRGWLI